MAKGVWLRRQDAFLATGLNVYQLDKLLRSCNRKMQRKTKFFFIQEDDLKEDYKQKAILVDEDDIEQPDQILTELNSNVDFTSTDVQMQSINLDLKKARKQKLIRQTKLIQQRLGQRKRQLFYSWSQRFFDCFSNHFGRLKNNIVELHLNEEQVNKFNTILDTCLNNMQLNLNQIWDQFQHQKQENE